MSYKRERRCRNFNDDGEPIGRGCTRGASCQFLHPNDPAWAQSGRRRNSDVNSYQSGPSHLPGNSGWGGPPSKAPSKDWDTSLWDSPSNKKDDNSTTKKWGAQSSAKKDAIAASPTSSVSNDWNMATDKGESSKSGTEGGWSNTDLPATWGIDIAGEWGGGDTGEGWGGGASVGGWNAGKTGDNTSTGGNDQKGKRGMEREDIEMRDSSPPRTVGSLKPTSLSRKPESAAPPLFPAQSTPPPSTVASKPARPIPLPLPSRQRMAKLYEDGNLTKLALLSVKNKDAEQVKGKSNSPSVHGPKGRADLFSQVLKQSSEVVGLQAELQRAQRDLARWKRTQESVQYERATEATKTILNLNRAMFSRRVQEAKCRLDRALSTLVDLPDFDSRSRKTSGSFLTKQKIAECTAELKEWYSDLERHKDMLMEREKKKADLSPAPVEGTSQLTAQQLVEHGGWSWNDIRNATKELDTRIQTAAEHHYSNAYTTITDFRDQTASLQDPGPMSLSTTKTRGNQSDAVSSANLVGDNLSAQATRAAELIFKIHTFDREQEQLDNEKRAMNNLCAEAEVLFSQFEQWFQNDDPKIQEMTEQLRTLHLLHKPPKTSIPTLSPAQLDGILLQLRPKVIDHVKDEVQPIFDALRSRCLENLEGMNSLIDELVTPALVMTDDICHRVSSLSL